MMAQPNGAVTPYCPNDERGEHDQRQHDHTASDGTVSRVIYCVKCNMEWPG